MELIYLHHCWHRSRIQFHLFGEVLGLCAEKQQNSALQPVNIWKGVMKKALLWWTRKVSHGSRTINRGREIDCKVLLFEHIGADNERYRHTDKYICLMKKNSSQYIAFWQGFCLKSCMATQAPVLLWIKRLDNQSPEGPGLCCSDENHNAKTQR